MFVPSIKLPATEEVYNMEKHRKRICVVRCLRNNKNRNKMISTSYPKVYVPLLAHSLARSLSPGLLWTSRSKLEAVSYSDICIFLFTACVYTACNACIILICQLNWMQDWRLLSSLLRWWVEQVLNVQPACYCRPRVIFACFKDKGCR